MYDEWLSARSREAEASVPAQFDLSQCVREEIHLLGGVQSYGTVVAARPQDGVVEVAAENLHAFFGIDAEDLVGEHVTGVLDGAVWEEVLEATEKDDSTVVLHVPAGPTGPGAGFDLSVHRREGLVVIEVEPRAGSTTGSRSSMGFYDGVRRALRRLRGAATVQECCEAAVREVRELTGFDRVVAYRFDERNGPGEVLAESVQDGWEPWLGLWFPATDIPPQARRLYEENWIRVIADVDDTTARLYPPVRQSTGRPLDLSGAALRTVSEFHLEYLRNIGVRSSMSVSLLREGGLWGLIACHGGSPAHLTPEVRSACELFGVAFSMQLAAIEERERVDALTSSAERAAAVVRQFTSDIESSLIDHADAVRRLVRGDGLLLVREDRVTVVGQDVPEELPAILRRHAARSRPGRPWTSDRLPEVLATDGVPPTGIPLPAGVLVLPLGQGGDFLAWLRTERPEPRQWAADPARPVLVGPRGERLTPRGSGAVFRSVIRGRSLPWTADDQSAAQEMWRLLTGLVLRHADELAALNSELRMTNDDLDSFAHVAAHDLKEPLRGISNAATFTLEDAADRLDPVSVSRLGTVRRLATRMDDLLNSLLLYARTGRAGLTRRAVSLDDVLDAAVEIAGPRLAEEHVRLLRPERLPTVLADPDRLYEVFLNLLVNAAKYAADRDDRTVEVGVENAVAPGEAAAVPAVVVRDNGMGIPVERQTDVFDLFRRLHGPQEHGGGTGVGLAVVRRIVERHGGRVWLHSEPGEGTAFFFTLGEDPAPGEAGWIGQPEGRSQ
ncbi:MULTISPECIES: ATP-binding protein [unclassified Streptomyces]|uniref:ATP-binding protein n=1 Tax=unclassified Streptomyces TaxID=2593676 RepID=UPI000DBA74E2|nr:MULTISPECIES: ATP-binding protein [unclassified Streptomyces]MYT71871.1 GAF domain-containing protein [Streptomyces sp. SID8367]RAJ75251.1 light-regulated signal transduction histidine kinase (bacteriophytochrome) [Streptomyces sp. PsTaAH-137]